MQPTYSRQDTDEVFAREREMAGGQEAPVLIGNVVDAVVQFKQVKQFTTFLAEYAIQGDDYIVHFFPPKERYVVNNGKGQVHGPFLVKWQRAFPQTLSPCAEEFFGATAPRLKAAYTAEMFSWWFKASGFTQRLDPDGFILLFFEKLDAALDASSFLA